MIVTTIATGNFRQAVKVARRADPVITREQGNRDSSNKQDLGDPAAKPLQPIQQALWGGTADCSYYDQKCDQVIEKYKHAYYCDVARFVCNSVPSTSYTDCVRLCLQEYDKQRRCSEISDAITFIKCAEVDSHKYCFVFCGHPF